MNRYNDMKDGPIRELLSAFNMALKNPGEKIEPANIPEIRKLTFDAYTGRRYILIRMDTSVYNILLRQMAEEEGYVCASHSDGFWMPDNIVIKKSGPLGRVIVREFDINSSMPLLAIPPGSKEPAANLLGNYLRLYNSGKRATARI